MNKKHGYRIAPFTINRQMVTASTSFGREQTNIHALIEADISKPRRLIRETKERKRESPSLTTYITTFLAKVISEYQNFNSFRKRKKLILLDDVTISVLVERKIN